MIKRSTIRRPTVAVRPSRIRREPVRVPTPAELAKAEAGRRQREIWGGVAGVSLFAAALACVFVGVSAATFSRPGSAAAHAARFGQCYNGDPSNCVLNGDTAFIAGDKVTIGGIDVPSIQGTQCEEERTRGIEAATRLAELLNGGEVTVGATSHDEHGREVSKVEVAGQDVAAAMIAAGVARQPQAEAQDWCD